MHALTTALLAATSEAPPINVGAWNKIVAAILIILCSFSGLMVIFGSRKNNVRKAADNAIQVIIGLIIIAIGGVASLIIAFGGDLLSFLLTGESS